jgi:hypothetical protein
MLVRFVVSPRLALVELLQEVWDLAGLFLSSSPSTIHAVAMGGAAVKDAGDNSRVYDGQRLV